jgi:tRNA(fMet)-specific endonuclease VapC
MVIFDTNILIELYRGNLTVKEDVANMKSGIFYVSSITAAEFIIGAKDKADFKRIEQQLDKYTVIPITADISDTFLSLFKTYTLSQKPSIPDILIAATALHYHLPLYTL